MFKYAKRFYGQVKAASYVEAAIALPIAIVVMFAFTYFSFALISMGILDHSANRTMRAITTHPAFDKAPPGECEDNANFNCSNEEDNENVCKSIYCIKEKAKQIPLGTFFGLGKASGKLVYLEDSNSNPKIDMPKVATNLSYEDAIKQEPVVVTLTAKLKSPFPYFSDISITSTATGFIEIRSKPNLPAIMDCNGYRKGDPRYKTEPCLCSVEKNEIWNPVLNAGDGGCETCKYDRKTPNADGSYPAGYIKWSDVLCLCPTLDKCKELYPHSQVFSNPNDSSRCRCGCHTNNGFSEVAMDSGIPAGGCQCAPAPYMSAEQPYGQYPSPDVVTTHNVNASNIVKFEPNLQIIVGTGIHADKCICTKLGSNGSTLNTSDCENIWAPIIGPGKVDVSYTSYCSCWCKDRCTAIGAVRITQWDPSAGCGCKCPGSKKFNDSSNTCECQNIDNSPMPPCVSPSNYNDSCVCECPNKDCGENISKSYPDCACLGCRFGTVTTVGSPRFGLCKRDPSDLGG